jgi:hypothetical protein
MLDKVVEKGKSNPLIISIIVIIVLFGKALFRLILPFW